MNSEKYQIIQDKENITKIRDILDTLPSFCKQFIFGIQEYTSTRTRLAYAYDIRVFFEFLHDKNSVCAKMQIKDIQMDVLDLISREDIEEYLDYMTYYEKDGKELTNNERGKSRKLSALRSMYNYFYQHEYIKKNTASLIAMPKQHEKEIIRLEPDEVAILLNQVELGTKLTKKQMEYHEKTKYRDVALLTLLLGTGLRVSECVGIDFDDLDFNTNGVRVHRKGGYDTVVYFGYEVETALKDYLDIREETIAEKGSENAVFLSMQNKRISVRAVENLVKKYAQTVTTLKKITPHKLRSTYGTSLYKETGDIYLVAAVLGHKDVNTTRRHYAAQDDDRRRSAANVVKLRDNAENNNRK